MRKLLNILLMVITLSLLSACDINNIGSKAKHLFRQLFTKASDSGKSQEPKTKMVEGVKVINDIAYGHHPKQKFDVYAPTETNGNAPIMVHLHGGGWAGGSKAGKVGYINKVNRWVPKGFVVILIETRLLPEADVYAQIQDLAKSIAVVQQRAGEWGANPSKLFLTGHSSAGTMVSVLAASPGTVLQYGGQPWLASFALDSTSLDIHRSMRLWSVGMIERAYGKDSKEWAAASPIAQLSHDSIPIFIACSTQRGDSPCEQAELFADEANNYEVDIRIAPVDYDHGGVDYHFGLENQYTRMAEDFMASLDDDVAKLLSADAASF